MPTYTYRCTDCGHDLEAVQAFSDASLTECPACGGRLRKTYGSVGIVFKGSGFYRNDSRKGSGESSESGESGAAAGKADKAEKGDGAPTKKPAETTAGDRTPGAGKSGDNGSSGGAKGSPGGATTSPAGGTTSAKAGSSTSSGSSAA